jgi:ketol-acid reductoisomerase
MAITIYREDDADLSNITSKRVAIIGYGNQGRAHALNMRDSGVRILIGQRPGEGFDQAKQDNFDPLPIKDASANADLIVLTLPDELAADIYDEHIAPTISTGKTLGFVHGFNIRYEFITPPKDIDVIMIAPKGPGTLVRSLYEQGKGLPALLAVHQDASGGAKQLALAWAKAIGSARAAIVETTFATETETDLFGEQVSLCGGLTALTKAAFETLVEAGYEPEFAYLECVHELKQVADLLYARGLAGMRTAISNTAEYGDLTRGPRLITDETRKEMKRILADVQSGAFAKEWIEETRTGGKNFKKLHKADENTPYEQAGKSVRALMPWLNGDSDGG